MENLIELLKNNRYAFGMWPDPGCYGKELGEAMQEKAKEIGKIPFEYFVSPHSWLNANPSNPEFCTTNTYRLRADYEHEPETALREMTIAANNSNCLCMYDGEGHNFGSIARVKERADFAGFRFKPVFGDEIYTDLWLNLDVKHNGNYKMTHASHVLFMQKKKE